MAHSDYIQVRTDTSWKKVFVTALRRTLSVARACDLACVSRSTAQQHRDSDPRFRRSWENAVEDACDDIEEALKKRAVRGYLKPIYWQGKRVGFERKFDTTAAMFLLRGRRKEVFGDAKSAITINNNGTQVGGGTVTNALSDKKLESMTPEELQRAWEDNTKPKAGN